MNAKNIFFSNRACPLPEFRARVGCFRASLIASAILCCLFLANKGSAKPFRPLTHTLPYQFPFLPYPIHKFYLSITQIQQTPNALQVISNVFWDDLETELSDFYQKKIFITDPNIQNYTQNYFKQYFLLYEKEKILTFRWIGMEITVDKAEIYLEYPKVQSFQRLALNNRILFRKFPEQKNMTHFITIDNKRFTIIHTPEDFIKRWK